MEMKKFAQGHTAGGKEGRETSRCHSKPVLNLLSTLFRAWQAPCPLWLPLPHWIDSKAHSSI